ncbi:dTDP-glucose 4,6-dehydratase [Methanococcoides sp. SA1]|nr:dTDP-glucose 4,6-dehydratase [Methanococcoides sp. SA1]
MKYLVTGGAGFIGSNFIQYVLDKDSDNEVINLDKLTYAGNLLNLSNVENDRRYTFIKGDICDEAIISDSLKDVDCMVNFAAETHVDRSITDADAFIKTNIFGTHQLLEAARKYDIETYLQISTDEVYGSTDNASFTELSPSEPNSPYSASKAGADMLVRAYNRTYGLPTLTTRSSNNYGPFQYPEKLIPKFILNALNDMPLPIYGDGLNVRDWLYVLDNCKAIFHVIEHGKRGDSYNIGAGNEYTNLEITKIILEYLGKSEELIKFVKDRPGHDKRYSVDTSKINQLGWKPESDFKIQISKTIQWYLDNDWWWKPLADQI